MKFIFFLCVVQFAQQVAAEVYFYRGPNGERLVSDRPQPGYELMNRRDSLNDAGHILAERPVSVSTPADIKYYIESASDRFGIDPALVEAVIQAESGYDPHAISSAGATGLINHG